MAGQKIPRKTVDALVAMAGASAMERIAEGDADAETAEQLTNCVEYLRERQIEKVDKVLSRFSLRLSPAQQKGIARRIVRELNQ